MYSALCGNIRVRDSERLLLQTFMNSFEYIVRRWGDLWDVGVEKENKSSQKKNTKINV